MTELLSLYFSGHHYSHGTVDTKYFKTKMTQTIVLLYFQGITAMEQLDLNSPDADPFSPGAVVTSSTTADPFAPATSPPLQPPPPLRPPQAVPRAAPRQAPAPVVPPAAAPVQPAPSADLFGEVQVLFFLRKLNFSCIQ